MYRIIFIITLTLSHANALASELSPTFDTSFNAQERDGLIHIKGRYSNYDYAYSVLIPKGLIGLMSPPPFPNHGFGIDLSKPQRSYLWVDASYGDAPEGKSFDDAIKDNLDFVKGDGVTDIVLSQKISTNLSRLRAVRFVIHYKASGIAMVRETVLAFRKNGDDVAIVYSINLRTPTSRYSKDRRVIDELQKTWRLKPLP